MGGTNLHALCHNHMVDEWLFSVNIGDMIGVLYMYIDFFKAYDLTDHQTFLEKKKYNCSENAIDRAILKGRPQHKK